MLNSNGFFKILGLTDKTILLSEVKDNTAKLYSNCHGIGTL